MQTVTVQQFTAEELLSEIETRVTRRVVDELRPLLAMQQQERPMNIEQLSEAVGLSVSTLERRMRAGGCRIFSRANAKCSCCQRLFASSS